MNKFTGKLSYFAVTFLLGAIIISFALTGFQGFNSSGDSVAQVDGTPITIGEYNRALNNEINRYSQIFGGKSLSSQQIKQFRLKENVLSRLVQQKVMLNMANNLELNIAQEEIKEEIKEAPFFQTNDKFDVNRYKSLLRANNLTPAKYEEMEKERLQLIKLSQVFESVLVSKKSVKEVLEFKNSKATVYAVSFDKESMTEYLPISKKEIKEFMDNPKNKTILQSVYNTMKSEINRPEQVKANHILLNVDGNEKEVLAKANNLRKKLTPANFSAMAKKHTDEEAGKKTGGDLGTFARGRMVPAFEKVAFSQKAGTISQPVKTQFGYHIIYVSKKIPAVNKTLEQVKDVVTLRHLRKTSRSQLAEFNKKLKIELKNLLVQRDYNRLKQMAKKYNFTFVEKAQMTLFDLKAGSIEFKEKEILPLFKTQNNKTIIDNDLPTKVSLLKIEKFNNEPVTEKELDAEFKTAQTDFANQLNNSLLKYLQDNSKVVTYPNLL